MPLGLSPSHAYSLRFILKNPGITPKILAIKMDLKLSTITRFIDKLTYKNLVERRKENEDKRECSLYPTKKGTELENELEAVSIKLYAGIREKLGTDEVDQMITLIQKFNTIINNHKTNKEIK